MGFGVPAAVAGDVVGHVIVLLVGEAGAAGGGHVGGDVDDKDVVRCGPGCCTVTSDLGDGDDGQGVVLRDRGGDLVDEHVVEVIVGAGYRVVHGARRCPALVGVIVDRCDGDGMLLICPSARCECHARGADGDL